MYIFLLFYEIYLLQENTTGWLSETIPRDLDEKTFIQVILCFCLSLRLNSIQLNLTKNSPDWESTLNFVLSFFDMKHLLFPWIYIVLFYMTFFLLYLNFKSKALGNVGAMTLASR